jgi:hypothetical protein
MRWQLPLILMLVSPVVADEPDEMAPPIIEISVAPGEIAFEDASVRNPIVLKDEKSAAKYLGEKELAELKKKVDFKAQVVLLFAWKGSGQDKLDYIVAESFPEQVFFSYKPGLTRDLRPHHRVFALRNDVKWRTP